MQQACAQWSFLRKLEQQNINKDSVKNPIPQVNALDSIAVEDLSEGAEDAIVVRARLIFDDKEPVPGASVFLQGTTKGTISDIDGYFAVKVTSRNKFENIVILG